MHIHQPGGELTAPFSTSPALQARQAPVGGRGLGDPAAGHSLGGR